MRIEEFTSTVDSQTARISATVAWEDNDRPTRELYIETTPDFAEYLTIDPTPFLVAGIVPAFHHGERRLVVDSEVCPTLLDGLHEAMSWLQHWYRPSAPLVEIEAPIEARVRARDGVLSAGSFLSGGLDSLVTLRLNKLTVPETHRASIKVCFFVYGFDMGGWPTQDVSEQRALHQRVLATLGDVAEDAQVTLVPVWTNIRFLDEALLFWLYEYQGAAMAAVAHAFDRRLHTTLIAASHDIATETPFGSCSVMDPCFSSSRLSIKHDGIQYSRLQKAEILSDWSAGLRNLRVCISPPPGELNCGECEKCVRTMLELYAAGGLGRSSAFTCDDITPEHLKAVEIPQEVELADYLELVPALEQLKRQDLVAGLRGRLRAARRYRRRAALVDFLRRLDQRFLGGTLIRGWRSLRRAGGEQRKP